MKDDGTGGDAIAGDGLFSATIPGQAANTLVAFYISATDSNSAAARFPAIRAGNNEPVRECLVLFGDGNPGGSFAVLHFWLTQANVNRWANLSDLSNELIDGTVVTGNRVIYNMQGRFAGSPYHQGFDTPVGNLCHYKWTFNDDDQFLGITSLNRLHQPGNNPGDDGSLQREQIANSFLRSLDAQVVRLGHQAVRQGLEASLGLKPGMESPSDPALLLLLEEVIHHAVESGDREADEAFNRVRRIEGGRQDTARLVPQVERRQRWNVFDANGPHQSARVHRSIVSSWYA